ncbi:D-alanine--D-alanine ligase [Rhodohalobacter sp. SW132]|uniref:D-alanine--D-alanine ligase n=1 Tax=Rhodohalobacter sp. SW132 TaxID=2293433 RepID=UPI000E28643C|nr:D-alanine--D-alanine ligase [Rhodohalobacter sp. SW132]REL38863.1 D-alanine--D-alanine ligase [Rhodohalobacter sp. SW132]
MKKPTVVVAFGGVSPEHEVSVLTGVQALSALEDSEYHTLPLYISKSGKWFTGEPLRDLKNYEKLDTLIGSSTPCVLTHNRDGAPVIKTLPDGLFSKSSEFPVYAVLTSFHGSAGENGSFQGIFEAYNIPYTGSGVMASAIGMDKVTAKRLCASEEIPVVEDIDFTEKDWIENKDVLLQKISALGESAVVKPVHLGSSIGVEVVKSTEETITAVETAFRYDDHLMVEKAISPLMEINCSVLGTADKCRASVCERPVGREELLSFTDKYQNDEAAKGMAAADRIIPADIPDELAENIQETSVRVFKLLQSSGLARLDFLVNADTNTFYFNEINTIPGSFSFYLWKENGIDFKDLLVELIEIAIQQHQKKNGRVQSYETNLLSQKAVKGMKGLKRSK